MKFLVVCTLVLGVCYAQRRPQNNEENLTIDLRLKAVEQNERLRETTTVIPIIRFDKEQGNDGSYKAAYETGNHIISQEEGFIKNLGPDPDSKDGAELNAQVQQGSYSYTAPDGQIITVNYIADEKGFHASGDHLPTPPPVSAEVQKGLDLIYAGIRAQEEAAAREGPKRQEPEYENPRQHQRQ